MSLVDPECFPSYRNSDERVCSACFDDEDLKAFIRGGDGPRGCSFCGRKDAPAIAFDELAEHIVERLNTFYGKAVDQLPYESREGGYQGWHVDTYDLLTEEVELSLPRDDSGCLLDAILDAVGDDTWCEFDWLCLEPDESLKFSWATFSDIVKYQRRFFFHSHGVDPDDIYHPDSRSPVQLLSEMCNIVERHGLIKDIPPDTNYYRARPRELRQHYRSAADLGPPPREVALQSNRMNPPGIPMFYGADRPSLAIAEIRASRASIGTFTIMRQIRLLDLAHLPRVPGFFSTAHRMEIMTLSFLHGFGKEITKPVPRNNRVNVDYIPTQVFTEFLRDYPFTSARIDGLMYASATGKKGSNVVLFAGPEDVEGVVKPSEFGRPPRPWLKLTRVHQT